jgi:hypothetical protein
MDGMSTTEKGTVFEEKIHGILAELLEKDELGIGGKHYQIHRQKELYSYLRKSHIKFDLVIEFYRQLESSPVFYVLVECKDYSHPVPVNDVEEFFDKASQVLHANFKCMLFTTNSLQQGAFNYAQSTGIAVVRILDDDSRTWIVERTNKHLTTCPNNVKGINVITALTNEYYVNSRQDVFGIANHEVFTSVKEAFSSVIDSLISRNNNIE